MLDKLHCEDDKLQKMSTVQLQSIAQSNQYLSSINTQYRPENKCF